MTKKPVSKERGKEIEERLQAVCPDSEPILVAYTGLEDPENNGVYYFADSDEGRIIKVTDDLDDD